MTFDRPTSKDEMYEILNQIFNYYRVVLPSYEQPQLSELTLARLDVAPLTDEQLEEKARALLACEFKENYEKNLQKLTVELSELNVLTAKQEEIAQNSISKLNEIYSASLEKVRAQAEKNGVIHTSAYLDKITYLENVKNAQIAKVNSEKENELALISAKIVALNAEIAQLKQKEGVIDEQAVLAKKIELKEKDDELQREVFKYNNGLDEKEKKYKNDIIRQNASLKMRYFELRTQELTRDQLIEMGYYDDVTECVCSYYDTLSATSAFNQIRLDTRLAIYLEDVYQNIVYMYGIRSGAIS